MGFFRLLQRLVGGGKRLYKKKNGTSRPARLEERRKRLVLWSMTKLDPTQRPWQAQRRTPAYQTPP
jgi:hypothetical protein